MSGGKNWDPNNRGGSDDERQDINPDRILQRLNVGPKFNRPVVEWHVVGESWLPSHQVVNKLQRRFCSTFLSRRSSGIFESVSLQARRNPRAPGSPACTLATSVSMRRASDGRDHDSPTR